MNELNIHITWQYFLGIMGGLLGISWYASSRFSKIENSIDWIRSTINELRRDMYEVRSDVDTLRADMKTMKETK